MQEGENQFACGECRCDDDDDDDDDDGDGDDDDDDGDGDDDDDDDDGDGDDDDEDDNNWNQTNLLKAILQLALSCTALPTRLPPYRPNAIQRFASRMAGATSKEFAELKTVDVI